MTSYFNPTSDDRFFGLATNALNVRNNNNNQITLNNNRYLWRNFYSTVVLIVSSYLMYTFTISMVTSIFFWHVYFLLFKEKSECT